MPRLDSLPSHADLSRQICAHSIHRAVYRFHIRPMLNLIEDATFQLVRFERRDKFWKLHLDHQGHVSQPAPELAED